MSNCQVIYGTLSNLLLYASYRQNQTDSHIQAKGIDVKGVSMPLPLPELLCDQELELFRLKQVEVLAQSVPLLHRSTVGQGQIPQLVHVLEEQPLYLSQVNLVCQQR